MTGVSRPATHLVSEGNRHEHVCDGHAEAAREGAQHGDTTATIHPLGPSTSTCIDCGGPTYCGVAHGAGHDHSQAATACTTRTRALAHG